MFRRSVVRRRGSPLLGTAIVGGAAYAAGRGAQREATRGQSQEQRLTQLEQQQGPGMSQQGMNPPQQGYQNMPPGYQSAPQQMYQQPPPPQPQMPQQTAPAQPAGAEYQAAPASELAPDKLTQLKTLGELRTSGVLTEAEFEAEKQRLLHS
jgi:hypothetical protein